MKKPRKNGKFISIKPKLLVKNPSEELAEFIGIMLGDGNINPTYWHKKKKKYMQQYVIRICGHKEDDKKYLINYVKPLVYRLFKTKFNIHYHKSKKALYLAIGHKNLYFTLLYWGLIPGNKKSNNVKIPDWIFSNKKYIRACIRGLIDTDGSVVITKRYKFNFIWLKSSIPNLRDSISKAMSMLNYKMDKWRGKTDTLQTCIGTKYTIKKYHKEISSNNPKHIKRFIID